MGNPARFANIGDRPYMRVSGKSYILQALIVDPLIHADCNVSYVETQLGQLISVVGLGKFSDTVLLEKLQCHLVVGCIFCLIQCRNRST